jgi:hypothetical protein
MLASNKHLLAKNRPLSSAHSRPVARRIASAKITMADAEQKKQLIADSIRGIPDFPKPGILFWDVTTLMLDPKAFQASIDLFVERYKGMNITTVAGEAPRGQAGRRAASGAGAQGSARS